jgi:hypothetical protein
VRHNGRWLADRIVGAKLGANSHRRQATLSPFKRSIWPLDLALGDTERHRATGRTSFASRGQGIKSLNSTLCGSA